MVAGEVTVTVGGSQKVAVLGKARGQLAAVAEVEQAKVGVNTQANRGAKLK